ncbi:MAG: hypothetical protein LBC07_01065, partial [Elusimicrobiota bacterium]|jgi:hypothetical protein|nr:hypothetical protein [Elusimicrobiota bacterium]
MIALAKKQILDRKYYEKYLNDKSDVILMPIAFAEENEKDLKQLVVKCEMEKLEKKVDSIS